jgi:hypothetical protein
MTFVEKDRFAGSHTEKALLKISWEGELFGVGLLKPGPICFLRMPRS